MPKFQELAKKRLKQMERLEKPYWLSETPGDTTWHKTPGDRALYQERLKRLQEPPEYVNPFQRTKDSLDIEIQKANLAKKDGGLEERRLQLQEKEFGLKEQDR
jgi:hypothetical protein